MNPAIVWSLASVTFFLSLSLSLWHGAHTYLLVDWIEGKNKVLVKSHAYLNQSPTEIMIKSFPCFRLFISPRLDWPISLQTLFHCAVIT